MRSDSRPVEIFRSHSSIETEVVRGLLDAHGIEASVSSPLSPSLFPMRMEQPDGPLKHAILADSCEAVIAALYLDGGVEIARTFIVSLFDPLLDEAGDQAAEAAFTEDWKSALQEWLQAERLGLPHYRLASAEGPDHRKRFDVEVLVSGVPSGRATGRSKKDAEQHAAKAALEKLKKKID